MNGGGPGAAPPPGKTSQALSVKDLFDAGALAYDAGRRRVIFCFDEFYGTLLDLVPFSAGDRFAFLDLGAGTGLVSALIRARFSRAEAHLLDISEPMLAQARQRFEGQSGVRYSVGDYAETQLPGPFPLVVSAMSIHHLADPQKQALIHRIFATLEPGGAFLHAELCLGVTPATERRYQQHWRQHMEASGLDPEELARIRRRMACDRPAPLEAQLGWMREAGFTDVDCFFKHYNFAVYAGTKPKSGG